MFGGALRQPAIHDRLLQHHADGPERVPHGGRLLARGREPVHPRLDVLAGDLVERVVTEHLHKPQPQQRPRNACPWRSGENFHYCCQAPVLSRHRKNRRARQDRASGDARHRSARIGPCTGEAGCRSAVAEGVLVDPGTAVAPELTEVGVGVGRWAL